MDSSDYLHSARRAAIVCVLLAIGALAAGLAVSAGVDAPVAASANPRILDQIQRRAAESCGAQCSGQRLALYAPAEGSSR